MIQRRYGRYQSNIGSAREVLVDWTSYHWHTIISTASLQMNIVLEVTQTMPLRNFHHRFGSLRKKRIKKQIS